jgi:RNA polymerase sigma factor (sigma-70 family)
MDVAEVIEGMGVPSTTHETMVDKLYGHGPMLLAAARVITLDNDEAEDLVQATFELALRHLDALREPAALRAWLLTIQTREAFRVLRRIRRLVSLDGRVAEIGTSGPDLAQRADVGRALAALPRRTRAAIALHHLAGLTVAETARALGVSDNTIKSQLRVGLARLREELRDG